MILSPQRIVAAHQYLYYVLSCPIWPDYTYDAYCKRHGIQGGGGSDLENSYPSEVITLAEAMLTYPATVTVPTTEEVNEWIKLPEPGDDADKCI